MLLLEEQQLFFISTKPNIDIVEQTTEATKPKKRKKNSSKDEGRKFPKYNQSIEQSFEKFLFGKSLPKVKIDESSSSSSSDEESDTEYYKPVQKTSVPEDSSSDSDSGK